MELSPRLQREALGLSKAQAPAQGHRPAPRPLLHALGQERGSAWAPGHQQSSKGASLVGHVTTPVPPTRAQVAHRAWAGACPPPETPNVAPLHQRGTCRPRRRQSKPRAPDTTAPCGTQAARRPWARGTRDTAGHHHRRDPELAPGRSAPRSSQAVNSSPDSVDQGQRPRTTRHGAGPPRAPAYLAMGQPGLWASYLPACDPSHAGHRHAPGFKQEGEGRDTAQSPGQGRKPRSPGHPVPVWLGVTVPFPRPLQTKWSLPEPEPLTRGSISRRTCSDCGCLSPPRAHHSGPPATALWGVDPRSRRMT